MGEVYWNWDNRVIFKTIDGLVFFKESISFIKFLKIASGWNHVLSIKEDNSNWSWGNNLYGQIGDNSTTHRSTPVNIGTNKTFCFIASAQHSLSIDNYGQVWAWGYNDYGEIGDNSTTSRSAPVSIQGDKKTFCLIDAGQYHSLGIDDNNQVWSWGNNEYGQLGNDSESNERTPVSIHGDIKRFVYICAGDSHSMGIDNGGNSWSWGFNIYGQLGDNTTESRRTPVLIHFPDKRFEKLYGGYNSSLGLDTYGQVWGWGWNEYGQIGNNSTTIEDTPVSIHGSKKTFCNITAGVGHSLGIDIYGFIWSWGRNTYGQLGDDSTTSRLTPVSIHGSKKTFCIISAGISHSLGVDNYGVIWSWGLNTSGQLGDNTIVSKNTPVRIYL
jgi:alpha-tubulin suppressor-like RCC1 family protein